MIISRKLTLKQRRFADNYIKCGNAVESAIKAGYSESYANSQSYKMLENVGEYIKKKNKEIEQKSIADMIEIKQFWTEYIRGKPADEKDKLKASELLARTNGAFLDKVEHSGDMGLNIRWTDKDD